LTTKVNGAKTLDLEALNMSQSQREELAKLASFERARRRFFHFCAFVKIIAGTLEDGITVTPLKLWPHVKTTIAALESTNRIVYAKSRQLGATTILSAYGLWHAMYVPNAEVIFVSKTEKDAWKILDSAKEIYAHLPPELKIPIGNGSDFPNNREQMTFSHGGKMVTFASTSTAGRGHTPTLVVLDEADYHEYISAALNSIGPGLDDNGGSLILASTVNPEKATSVFQDTYKSAPINGYTKLFFGWRSRPDRDDAWYARAQARHHDASLFRIEHAETEAEAFAPAQGLAAFNINRLTDMQKVLKPPIEVMPVGITTANIYQDFLPGRKYAAGTDPSHGVGGNGDDAVTAIMDITTGAVVADIKSNTVPPDQLALASIPLLERYHLPIWAIEDNEWGILAIKTALDMRYPRLFYRDEGNKCGWHTDERSRNLLWGELREAVETGILTIFSEPGLNQFFDVIYRQRQVRVRIEAREGGHDDYPMAVGIAWQMRHFARKPTGLALNGASKDNWGSIMRETSLKRW
jgi:hypothetical protein